MKTPIFYSRVFPKDTRTDFDGCKNYQQLTESIYCSFLLFKLIHSVCLQKSECDGEHYFWEVYSMKKKYEKHYGLFPTAITHLFLGQSQWKQWALTAGVMNKLTGGNYIENWFRGPNRNNGILNKTNIYKTLLWVNFLLQLEFSSVIFK